MRHVPVLLDMSEPRVLANGQNLEELYRKEVLLIPARLVAACIPSISYPRL